MALICSLFLFLFSTAHGKNELPEFYRGVRAMGMGNAFTAIADDADALYYNPAGLALNTGIQFRLLNPKIELSNDDLLTQDQIKTLGDKGYDTQAVKDLFGKNVYASGTLSPLLIFPYFAIGYYAGIAAHAVTHNLSYPSLDLSLIYDQGFVGGVGYQWGGFSKLDVLRAGLMVKAIRRRGFSNTVSISTLATVDNSYLDSILSSPAMGYGVDLGFQYEVSLNKNSSLTWGTAWHDVGGTSFGNRNSSSRPPSIQSNLAAGWAYTYRLDKRPAYNFKFALEGRHLEGLRTEDPKKMLHFGAELALGGLSFQAGMSQFYWSAGVSLDMYIFELSASSYAIENFPLWGESKERRYALQVTFKLDASDGRRGTKADWERKKRPRLYGR